MNINGVNIQIMWTEIVITFFLIGIVRYLINMYILHVYNNIYKEFISFKWEKLDDKIRKHKKLCNVFSNGPYNKKIRLMYNGLCMALSSMALIRNHESGFIEELNDIKQEEEFELKAFVLALYYRSNNNSLAIQYFNKYVRCIHQNKNIELIMKYLFDKEKTTKDMDDIKKVIKCFRNPAIICLLKQNGLILDE